jgi:hypothetical protein
MLLEKNLLLAKTGRIADQPHHLGHQAKQESKAQPSRFNVLARVSAWLSCHKRQASLSLLLLVTTHRRDRQGGLARRRGRAGPHGQRLVTSLHTPLRARRRCFPWCLVRACRSIVTASSRTRMQMQACIHCHESLAE